MDCKDNHTVYCTEDLLCILSEYFQYGIDFVITEEDGNYITVSFKVHDKE